MVSEKCVLLEKIVVFECNSCNSVEFCGITAQKSRSLKIRKVTKSEALDTKSDDKSSFSHENNEKVKL